MSEPGTNNPGTPPPSPELHRAAEEPKGVLQKNLKPLIYLGAAALVIVAAVFSSTSPKNAAHKGASVNQPPQPMLQDTTEANVQDLKNQVAASRQQKAAQGNTADPATTGMTPAQQAAAAAYATNGRTACAPGQPCSQPQGGTMQEQLSPVQQQEQQLAAHDRELAYTSRFASNLVYSSSAQAARQQTARAAVESDSAVGAAQDTRAYAVTPERATGSLVLPRTAGEQQAAAPASAATQRKPEVNIDSATGQPYVIYEGTTLDTVLMNRLDGDAAGPVKVLVSNPVYSHDRQHVLIPEGAIVLGEARKIGSSGFAQQRRTPAKVRAKSPRAVEAASDARPRS